MKTHFHVRAPRSLLTVLVAVLLSFCACSCALGAPTQWTVSVDERTGLPQVVKGGGSAMVPGLVFWGANWKWANTESRFEVASPYRYVLEGRNKELGFDLRAEILRSNGPTSQLVSQFRLNAADQIRDVIGGGMVFKFDVANFGDEMGVPVLLEGNRGWSWGRKGAAHLEMRFDPPLADVYFERGNKNEVRAFFYKGSISKGTLVHNVVLTTSGNVGITQTTTEKFGATDTSKWPVDHLDVKFSPVDLSFLNAKDKPAGSHGFVKSKGEALAFADGTPVRFWGTNLTANALFGTPKEAVRLQAKRLAALGFNLARLHHHDSSWVNPNIFGDRKALRDTSQLSAESLDKLDWWIKCLKDEGIYVWLDLHVERHGMAGDNWFGFDEIRKGKDTTSLKGYNYFNNTIQEAMQRFNRDYVNHVNPYTGKAYKDEPAIAAMLITNENDITHHFGNSLLPDKKVPQHNRLYMEEADRFSARHNLPKDKVWRSWEHGPSKVFLNSAEQRFSAAMITHLRSLGVQVPIVTTSTWGNNPLSSLPALTAGDLVDVHAYGDTGQLEKNPLFAAGMIHWMAAAQVAGKPLSVTEWNAEPFPTPDRHILPLLIGGSASLQGWDALMQYAYAQVSLNGPGSASNWHSFNDPALLGTLPAAALLYRRGDVRESTTTYVFDPGPDMLFDKQISPANSRALRTAAERGKLVIAMPQKAELPWLRKSSIPPKAHIIRDPSESLIDADATEVTSDTGELRHQWSKGVYTINTPNTQAAMGWIGGESISIGEITIKAKTRNATIAVQSLDNSPIGQSRDVLISLGARAVPQQRSKTPFHVEPVEGELSIRASPGLRLFKRDARQEMKEIPVAARNGLYTISLDSTLETNWLFLRQP